MPGFYSYQKGGAEAENPGRFQVVLSYVTIAATSVFSLNSEWIYSLTANMPT
jgi:hypothetical protein